MLSWRSACPEGSKKPIRTAYARNRRYQDRPGRQIELVPGERVVQAWRSGSARPDAWEPGVYSIVRVTLRPEGDTTRFAVDHNGIPPEWEDHIRSGCPTFYEAPLARHFGG